MANDNTSYLANIPFLRDPMWGSGQVLAGVRPQTDPNKGGGNFVTGVMDTAGVPSDMSPISLFDTKKSWTETIPSDIPIDKNSYDKYVTDLLMVNSPLMYPDRYKQSLAGYAGAPSGFDPVAFIQDLFLNPIKYGVYDAPTTKKHKGESFLDKIMGGLF